MVGGFLASTEKSGRKQNLLSPTSRLRGRKQQLGERHEASPGKKAIDKERLF
jgi:hypothetical protein